MKWLGDEFGPHPMAMTFEWLRPYAACFGIGVVLMSIVLLVVSGRTAGGHKVSGLELLRSTGVSALLYVPVMTVAPGIVVLLWTVGDSIGSGFAGSVWDELLKAINGYVADLGWFAGPAALVAALMTPPLVIIIVLAALVVFAFLLGMELALAQYALYVLTCLVPIVAALAVLPQFRRLAQRLLGALAGVMLVKPIIWLCVWIGWTSVQSVWSSADVLGKSMYLLAVCVVLVAVPALPAMVLPHLIEAGGEALGHLRGARSAAGRTAGNAARTAGREGRQAVAKQRVKSEAAKKAAAKTAETATATGVKAGTAATGVGAPVAAAMVAADAARKGAAKVKDTAVGSASRNISGGSGGESSAPAPAQARPAASGGGGQVAPSPSTSPARPGPSGGGSTSAPARPTAPRPEGTR